MKKNRVAVASIALTLVGVSGCSDSPVGPTTQSVHVRAPSRTGLGLTLLANASAGLPSTITVCSANASANFTVSTFSNNNGTAQVPPLVGAGPYTLTVAAGSCATIWRKTDFTVFPVDPTTTVTITQTGQQSGYQFQMVEAEGNNQNGNPAFPTSVNQGAKSATVHANAYHGGTATFTQQLMPTGRCTYTKGWYQSKHATDGVARDIVPDVEGLTVNQQSQIFNATPGKPGNVVLGGPNNLLNLVQQLLAAINNLNGNPTAGPTALDNAIAAAQTATNISWPNVSTGLTNGQIGALIGPLSDFNEGKVAGFVHCSD